MPAVRSQSYFINPRTLLSKRYGANLLIVCVLLAGASVLLSVSTGSKGLKAPTSSYVSKDTPPVFIKGPGNLRFRTKAAASTKLQYYGSAADAMQSGSVRPLSLGAGDFNLDGAPDLVTGYAGAILTVQFGNKDAFAPTNPAVYKSIQEGRIPPTFGDSAITYPLPADPDFLLVQDFDNDGIKDVLAASRAGGFYLLTGDGAGGLTGPRSFNSQGRIAAVAAGQFNRRDGLTDLAVAVVGPQGPVVQVYQGAKGGFSNTPLTFSLPAEASFVGLEDVDGDIFSDLVVAAADQVVIIHGGKSDTAEQRETINVGFSIKSAAFGNFVWDRDSRPELSLLAEDGTTHLLQRNDLDTRPFTDEELAVRAKQLDLGGPADPAAIRKLEVAWQSHGAPEWVIAGQMDVSVSADTNAPSPLMGLRMPGRSDGLIALDSSQQRIRISAGKQVQTKSENQLQSQAVDSQPTVEVPQDSHPVAAISLPPKVNGEREVLVLDSNSLVPNGIVPQAATSITVDRFDDPALLPAALPATAPEAQCTAAANDCSLRGAIIFSNQAANQPTTINLPAGTYNLSQTLAGNGENNGRLDDLNPNGDGTVITGAGSATTTIQWSPAVPNANRDRIMQFNATQAATNFDFTLSGVTLTGGFFTVSGSGGGVSGGSTGTSTYTFTDCIFDNNTANNNGGGMSISFDLQIQNVTLTNCKFTNNTASTGAGGGFNYLGAGTVTVSAGTIISGNQANQGGGMTLGGSAGPPTFNLPKLSITSNNATADGGGLMLNSGNLNLSFSRIFANTSGSCGDGLCRAGGAAGTATATNNWWGCNTDPTSVAAAQADGCDAVAPGSGGTNPTVNPRLFLTHTANPALLCRNTGSLLTASFLFDSNGGAVSASNLDRLIGLPITFNNAINGAISSPQATIQANGKATATFTTGANHGAASADATVDNGTVTASLTVPDSFTSVQTGNFDTATTWTPQCVPQSDDSVTIANTHTVSLPANDSIADVTINSGGTLNTNAFNLDVNSSNNLKNYASVNSWSNSGTLSGLGTITFNGDGVRQQFAGTTTFNNLTVNHTNANSVDATGSTLAVNALTRVQGGTFIASGTFNNVQVDSGATLQGINATTMNVGGNWTNGGTFTPSGNTVVFNGSGSQTIGGNATTGFNVLTLSNTANPILVSPTTNLMNVGSTFTINSNVILSPAATAVIGGTGTLTGNGTALVTRTAAAADFLTQYTITNKTLTNLTVDYTGAGNQTVNNAPAYGHLRISGSGTKTLQGNTTITGNLNIAAATFASGNFNFTLGGNWTNGSTFTQGTGSATVTFNGSGAQTVTGNTTFHNLSIAQGGGGTIGFGSTTTTVDNQFSRSGGTSMDPGTGTFVFTGTSGSIVGASTKTFNNLQIDALAVITHSAGNITIGSNFTNNGTFTQTPATLTTTFDATNATHSFSGNGTTTFGGLTISGVTTVNAGSHSFNVAGSSLNVSNASGVFSGDTSTVTFSGASAQQIAGPGLKNFAGLTINSASTVTVNNDVVSGSQIDSSVSGLLTLTSDLTVASGGILLQSGTSAGGADVVGTVRRTDLAVGTERSFGNVNNSILLNAATGVPTQMDFNLVKSAPGAPFPATVKVVPRTYTLTPTGGSGISATLKLRYTDAELAGPGITESRLVLWKNLAPPWAPQGGVDDGVNNFVSLSGVTGFSQWAIAEGGDLTLAKTNNVSNAAVFGQPWNWTLTATNGGAPVTFTAGQTIITDNLPNANINYGAATPGGFSNITGSGNISCSIVSNDLTCTANGGSVTFDSNLGVSKFDVVFSATPTATGSYVNPRSGGTAKVDPNDVIIESDNSNNTATNTVTVSQANTTTGVTSTQNPSVFGQSVTFTATVAVTAPGAGTPTGTVNFLDNLSPIATCQNVPLTALAAQCSTAALSVGNHPISAVYSGDSNFNTSTGNLTGNPQVVNQAGTTTQITLDDPDPSLVGNGVTVNFTVTANGPGAGTPTGNVVVTVNDASGDTCNGNLSAGAGTCNLVLTTAGAKVLTATYGGDGNFTTSNDTENHNVIADLVVNKVADTNDNICDADCSLREAITVANATPGTNTIKFDINPGSGPHTIQLDSALPAISESVNIINVSGESITVNGEGAADPYRVFTINSGQTVSIVGLNISGGNATNGGGILNSGTLTVTNSTVNGNTGTANGGGVFNDVGGTLRVINSTVSGNSATLGGGIYNDGALVLTNATIAANTAATFGGGLYNNGTATFTMNNTIVAGNTVEDIHTGSGLMSGDYNLIGDTTGITGSPSGTNNVLNQAPNLAGLAFNGGPTKTHALLFNSPAIEKGNNALAVDQTAAALTTDQRGTVFPRIADSADADTTQTVDIGAFELHPSVQDITDKTTAEDTALPQITFNIGDGTGALISSVTATSGNTTLIPNANIALGGSGSSRTLDISPAADRNTPSDGTATITVTVTATNGQTATDTFVVTVTEVNDAPVPTNDPIAAIDEDCAAGCSGGKYVIPIASLLLNDTNKGAANESGQNLNITGLSSPTGGTVAINGANIEFTPTANFSGAAGFTYTVTDDGTTNGVADPKTGNATVSFTITAVNDAPAGADKTVTTLEDTAYTFATADFGFSDPNDSPANNLLAVKITTLPAAGSLKDNNVAVVAGQFIPVADITGGKLKFTPAADANGTPYASFTFQVQDDGGTANSGVDVDQSPNTMTVNVTAVNDAPAGADKTVTTLEDTAYTFATADFGFTDPNDSPANNLLAVKITTLPAAGSLTDNNVAVVAGQFIPLADITGGKLKFTPAANANGTPYASFTFQVQDDGGTANSGVDLDQSPNTMTVNVTAVNDAPGGADKTVTILEDNSYTFASADFGFTDPNDSPANNLLAVKITTLPAAGSLTDNNVAVVAGQFIPLADITGGKLKFTPAANAYGTPYASFTFQVQDDGGTANSGVDLDQSPNTVTVNVTSVNDAPAGADNTVSTNINTAYVFAAADFGFTDPNDSPANALLAVKITTLPAAGSLTDNNVAVVAGQFIQVADINGGKLKFTPAANASGTPYASFTFQVQDDGGTTNGGVDLDATPNTMTINVGQPALKVLDAVRAEPTSGTANMLFTVVMNPQLAAQTVTVDYQTANGGGNPATSGTCGNPGVDYQPTSGTLTFNPGETTKTIKVGICSDNVNEPDETLLLNLSNANGATISRPQATGTIKQANLAGTFIISEIRTSGPGGLGDDFVELYNNTDTPLTVAASDASAGYGVFKMGTDCNATPALIATIPNGTVIPARAHYLLVGSQYSLANYGGSGAAAGDQTLTSDIESDRNVGLFNTADGNNLSTVTRLDGVGFGTNSDGVTTGVCDLLREGTNLPALSGSTLEYSFFRKECDFVGSACTVNGLPKDTNDNSADFKFADTQGTLIVGVTQALGAPGPQNKASGIQRNATLVVPLLDSTKAPSAVPNRDRTFTPNPPTAPNGVLSIRRRIQNNTGGNVTALRFRIIDITTFPSPGSGTADLRAITSSDVVVGGIGDATTCGGPAPCSVTVKGTTLETPPAQSNGGGYNSTLRASTVTGGTPLAAGASINVNLAFGVVQGGYFRVLINVEDDVVGGDPKAPGMTLASFVEEVNVGVDQTVNFAPVSSHTFGDSDFNVSASASSGLPVSYAGSGNCQVSSAGQVHLTGAGACTITATQAGDSGHNPASTQQTFAISKATAATSVSSSLNAAKLTQNVTFTATVTPPANTTGVTGLVQFRDNGVDLGPAVALNSNGVANFSTAALSAGTHAITAVYSGNANFNASSGTLASAQVVTNRPLISFAMASYEVKQSEGFVRVVVNRTGDTTAPVTVDYATEGSGSGNCAGLRGVASLRCDVTAMYGTFKFAAGETRKVLDIPINQDSYAQGPETFTVNLSNATGLDVLLTTPASANVTINDATSPTPNAIDDTTIFVRQQYHDFLNREPDAAGLAFWKNNIDVCNTDATEAARYGGVSACLETKRVITSAAFFLSIEFRGTGGLVRDFYVASLDRPASGNMPGFTEFTRDTQAVQNGVVVGQTNWQQALDANRAAFMQDFVMRPEFVGLYGTTDTPAQYVDKLYSHANVTPDTAERNAAIAEFGSAATAAEATARGRALLRITQSPAFQNRELNRSFVQMQYFGYLRRNPSDDPDNNLTGFTYWLGKLNQFNGDYIAAEMVKAFLSSNEYRQRFGQP